jgi:hypothetical protein
MASVQVRYIVRDVDAAIAFYAQQVFEPLIAEARLGSTQNAAA